MQVVRAKGEPRNTSGSGMSATADAVRDGVKRRRWDAFSNGFAVDQGEYEEPEPEPEPEVDEDSDIEFERDEEPEPEPEVDENSDIEFERVAVEEERNAGHARVEEQGIAAAAAARHCQEEEELPGDGHARLQGRLLAGTKRKAAGEHDEPATTKAATQDGKGEYIAEDSYAQIGDRLLQTRNMEATMKASKLQPTTGPQIHDKRCSGCKKAHQVAAEEENVGVAVSDGKMTTAAQAPVEDPSSGGAADSHCDEEEVSRDCYVQLHGGLLGMKSKASVTHAGTEIQDEQGHEKYVPWDCYVQLQGGLLGRKRKAIATHAEPQTTRREIQGEKGEYISDDNDAPTGIGLQGRKREATVTPGKVQMTNESARGECLRAENEMLRQQLMRKTKELEAEAEKIRILKIELDVKDKEIKSLEKQNKELRCGRERALQKNRKASKKPSAVL